MKKRAEKKRVRKQAEKLRQEKVRTRAKKAAALIEPLPPVIV